jgi:hypothetical protein
VTVAEIPPKLVALLVSERIHGHRATFKFQSSDRTGKLECAVVRTIHGHRPKRHYAACKTTARFVDLKAGRYVLYVRVVELGVPSGAPATYRFTIH